MNETRIAIIGAGVIGLAIAYELSKSTSDIVVLEKEDSYGCHTSSRNSEVIHAGLYYLPGSLKAQTCIRGKELLYEWCSKYNIQHKKTGKLVVATDNDGCRKIEEIYNNAYRNGVKDLRFLGKEDIRKLEPNISAKKGFFSSNTGIVDTHGLMNLFYSLAKQNGVTFAFSTEVLGLDRYNSKYKVMVREANKSSFSFFSNVVVNSGGLWSDKVAQMAGIDIDRYSYRINYCRGQYFRMRNPKKFSINHLIYPPPTSIDLGMHITPDLGGGLRLGPDANYTTGIEYDVDENDKDKFHKSVSNFLPYLKPDDLMADTVGIRPKLQKETEDFRDFVIAEESEKGFPGLVNLIGIESPGLTSCLAITEVVKGFIKNELRA